MKKIVRILHIEGGGDLNGGGPVSLFNFLKNLDREAFVPIVACPSPGSFVDALKEIGVKTKIIEINSLKRLHLISFVSAVVKLRKIIKEEKIDIVHSNAGASRESFYSGIAARISGVPFIYHVRVIESGGLVEKIIAALSAKVIVISDAIGKKFDYLKNKNKLIKIYNAVNLKEYTPDLSPEKIITEFGLKPGAPLIGVIANLIPWKGHEYFLNAAREIKDKVQEAKFIIAGQDFDKDKRYEKQLKRMTEKLGIGKDVIFTGFRADVPEIMAAIDILVLPSIDEPFGRVLIEAMACAKPIVATKGGGVPEIVRDRETGLLVPIKDPHAISVAVIGLLKDKKRAREMGLAGRKIAEEVFDIEKKIKRMENIYNELLEKKK